MFRLSPQFLHRRNITSHYFLTHVGTKPQDKDSYLPGHYRRSMATGNGSSAGGIPHEVRTATEPRQNTLHQVRLSRITQENPTIRLLRLTVSPSLTLGREGGDSTPIENIPKSTFSESAEEPTESNIYSSGAPHPCQSLPFLPGQWLDVHIPSIPQAGGFTITSTPTEASSRHSPKYQQGQNDVRNQQKEEPYLELAVQNSPSNPPAAWLWRPESEILGKELRVRVGGSFVWPPASTNEESLKKIVFVAGGVGINPIISMLSHIYQSATSLPASSKIHILYSSRLPKTENDNDGSSKGTPTREELDHILFIPRLREIIRMQRVDQGPSAQRKPQLDLNMYITNSKPSRPSDGQRDARGDDAVSPNQAITRDMTVYNRRITSDDLRNLVDDVDPAVRAATVSYVCGPPHMTDEFVEILESILEGSGERKKKVFYEKWW